MDLLPESYTYKQELLPDGTCLIFIKEVKDELSAKRWLQEFSDLTKVTWRKTRTYPRSGRHNCFKVDMHCQHVPDKRIKGVHTKKTQCTATLQIKVVGEKEQGEWPATIRLKGYHDHPLDNPLALQYRDMSSETKEKLISLFHQGHDPASALHCLKTDLLLKHGKDYYKFSNDGKFVPSASIVRHLFYKEFSKEFGCLSGEAMLKQLNEKLNDYTANDNGKALFSYTTDKEHYFIVICTPLMIRAQEAIPQTKEIVLLDSSGGMDKEKHRLYLFITPTAAGGVPLAAIIADSEKRYVFDEAVQKLKEMIPNSSQLNCGPQVFMTDNDLKERDCLKKHFPKSRLLLCQFHILKAVWAWLLKAAHNIQMSDRQEIYFLFKNVLYARSKEQFLKNDEKLKNSDAVKKYSNFQEYYEKLCQQREDWATCFRSGLAIRGTNTTNYVEAMFRIIKECILKRVMAFNLSQFTDFIITRFEMYFQKRLIDFCHDRYSSYTARNLEALTDKEFTIKGKSDDDVFYLYDSEKSEDITVDISNGMCSCSKGNSGNLCEHSSYLLKKIEDTVKTDFKCNRKETKETLFYVANGTMPPPQWFDPMISVPSSALQIPQLSSQPPNTEEEINICPCPDNKEATNFETPPLTEGERLALKSFYKRIDDGLEKDPENYIPAVRKLITNINSTKTDTSFLSALHTFGKYQGHQSIKCANKLLKRSRSHSNTIGVQPTALGRRAKNITGQKIVKAGRPKKTAFQSVLRHHDYTTFGYLPKRKRKATHNLEDCVLANKSLGD